SQLAERAAALLAASLGGGDAAQVVAKNVATAFLAAHGGAARRQLLALGAALRGNEKLRESVLNLGPKETAALARQDPREWAGSKLQAQRLRWAEEALRESQVPVGTVAICPECGGRALVDTGRAGSGRAARLSKQYAHFTCQEEQCGKVTHVKEG
ncbi:unnamed protein product, partial [Polarella glacialis]